MYCDGHVHCRGEVDGSEVLKEMDRVEMEKVVLLAPHVQTADQFGPSLEVIKAACAPDPDRLIGFAWIEPTLPEAVEHVRRAAEAGLKGIKMIPNHWYPYEERLFPVYEEIERLRLPILFHSGILFSNMDSSRFCQPVYYEVMLHFPRIKFSLAHISWPWTDECIAVFGRMRASAGRGHVPELQMYIDITRGTPGFYRVDALERALKYVGPERLIFGSDSVLPGDLSRSRQRIDEDRHLICEHAGRSEADFRRIAAGNLEEFLKPMD